MPAASPRTPTHGTSSARFDTPPSHGHRQRRRLNFKTARSNKATNSKPARPGNKYEHHRRVQHRHPRNLRAGKKRLRLPHRTLRMRHHQHRRGATCRHRARVQNHLCRRQTSAHLSDKRQPQKRCLILSRYPNNEESK